METLDFKIRKAIRGDIPGIAHVAATSYIEAFGEHFLDKDNLRKETEERRSEKYFEKVFDEDVILVAEINNFIVGYIQFGKMSMTFDAYLETDIQLNRLYLLAEFHSRGIGKALLEAMLVSDELRETTSVYLEVWEENPKALGLYKSYGFEDTGHRRPFFENGIQRGEDSVFKKTIEVKN